MPPLLQSFAPPLVVAATVAAAVAAAVLDRRRRRAAAPTDAISPRADGLIFTGTGCSSGLPLVQCALEQPARPPHCAACGVALARGRGDRNWRGNVGALLRFTDPRTGALRYVQIDCGKTFREVVTMRVYRQHGVKWLDALVLTHEHMDAVGGLDELRSLQMFDPSTYEVSGAIRCFCDRRSLSRLRHIFPYLFPRTRATAPFASSVCQCCELDLEGPRVPVSEEARQTPTAPAAPPAAVAAPDDAPVKTAVKRFVAKIDWCSFGAVGAGGQPLPHVSRLEVCGLELYALPVLHGTDYTCFGYGWGPVGRRSVYLSDYTELLPETEALLARWCAEGRIDLLVLDALHLDQPHAVHASALQSIQLARRLQPRKTLLVGMSHSMEHEETNETLRAQLAVDGLDVQLAYDGQFVPLAFF